MQDQDIEFTLVPKLDSGALNSVVQALDKVLESIGGIDLIGDETKKELDEARKGLKSLGDAVPKNVLGGLDNELDQVGKKGSAVGSIFDKAFKANQAIEFANQISGMVSTLSQPFVALDTATAQLKTLGAEAAAMAPNLREAAITMSKDLPFAAAEIQTAMFDALASGVQGGEEGLKNFADVAAKLAVGGGAQLSEATNLLAGNLNAYGKSAEDAAKFSDIFFNTINYGVTSAAELTNTLSNVVPTAAAAGIELEAVGASMAVLTSKGVPSAQATTKLNALLLELQKPAAALAPILKEAGISLDSLKNDDLPVTLGKLDDALKRTGKAAVEVFSSSEAGAGFAVLAGDLAGFAETFENVRDTTGSAQNAYEEMSGSIQVQTDQMLASVNAFVIQGMDTIGPAFIGAAQGATQLAPMVTTLTGLGSVLPDGFGKKIADMGSSIGGPLVSGLKGAVTGLGSFLTTLGPVGLALAGVAAAVAVGALAYELFRSKTKDLADASKDAAESLTKVQDANKASNAAEKQAQQLDKLATKYESLEKSIDPKNQAEFAKVTNELARRVPEAADGIADLTDRTGRSGIAFDISTKAVREFANEQKRLADEKAADALAEMDDNSQALLISIQENTIKMGELRSERDALKAGEGDGFNLFGGDPTTQVLEFIGVIDLTKNRVAGVREEINTISPELKAAREQQQKQIEGYAEMGFSIEQVAERLGTTKEVIASMSPPDFKSSIVNAKEFQDAIKGVSAEQQQSINQVVQLGESYNKAQADVDVLTGKLADAKFGGDKDLEAKLTADLEAAQKIADEKKLKLSTQLDDEDTKAAMDALPAEAKKYMKPIEASIILINDEKALKETQAKANAIGREISDLQKEQAAAAGTANEKIYSDKLIGKAEEYKQNLISQLGVLGTQQARYDELAAAKDKSTDDATTKRLTAEMATLEKSISAGSKQFGNAAANGKKLGLIKGDVKDLGTEFNLSGKSAAGISTHVKQIEKDAKGAAEAAGDIGAAFEAAQKSAGDTVNKLASTYAGNLIALQGELSDASRLQIEAQQREIKKQALAIQVDLRAGKSAVDAARRELGFNAEADAKKAQEEAKRRADERKKERERLEAMRVDRANFEAEQASRRRTAHANEIDDEYARTLAIIQAEKSLEAAKIAIIRGREGVSKEELQEASQKEIQNRQTFIEREKKAEDDARKRYGADILKLRTEIATQNAATLRDQAAAITGDDVRSIRERSALINEAMEIEADSKRQKESENNQAFATYLQERTKIEATALIEANKTFALEQQRVTDEVSKVIVERQKKIDLAIKQKRVPDKPLTDEEVRADLARFGISTNETEYLKTLNEKRAALITAMLGMREDVLEAIDKPLRENRSRNDAENALLAAAIPDAAEREKFINTITDITRDAATAATAETAKTGNELKAAILEARLATISDTAERERVQNEIESTKTLDAQLKTLAKAEIALAEERAKNPTGDFSAQEAAIQAARENAASDHAERMALIERERLRDNDPFINAALAFQEVKWGEHFGKIDKLRIADLEKQRDVISESIHDLEEQYKRGEINVESYYSKINELRAESKAIEDEINAERFNVWRDLASAGADAFTGIAEYQKKELDKTLAGFAKGKKDYEDIALSLGASLTSTAIQVGLTLASEGKNVAQVFEGTLDVVIGQAFDVLQSMVPIWSAQILGYSLATPTAIATFGASALIQWAALTGLLTAAVQGARALSGFHDGGYTGDGDEWEYAGPAHKKEFIHRADVTAVQENRLAFEHLHNGGSLYEFAQLHPEIFGTVGYDDIPKVEIDYAVIKGFPDDPLGIVEAMKYGSDPVELARAYGFMDLVAEAKQQTELLRAIDTKLERLEALESRLGNLETTATRGNVNTKTIADEIGQRGRETLAHKLDKIETAISQANKSKDSRRS